MSLSEEQIRTIARIAKEELGENATLERLRDVVRQTVNRLETDSGTGATSPLFQGRILAIFLSCDGLKNSRVLAQVTKATNCRITERWERNLAGFQTLLAVIDTESCHRDFNALRTQFSDAGNAAGVRIILQSEDILKQQTNNT